MKPQFFDIFGALGFAFIVFLSIWALISQEPIPKPVLVILLLVGIIGLIVDSVIVYKFYLKKKS